MRRDRDRDRRDNADDFDADHDGLRWRAFLGSYYYLAPNDNNIDNIILLWFNKGLLAFIHNSLTTNLE